MRSSFRTAALVATLAVASLSAAAARADIVLSNFASGTGGTLAIPDTSTKFALNFTTGTNPLQLEIASVQLSLSVTSGTSNPVFAIFSNSAGNPGTSIGSFSSVSVSSVDKQIYTFTPSATLVLSANTTYWAVLSNGPNPLAWTFMDDISSEQNTSGYSVNLAKKSINNGSTWSNNITASAASFQVQAVPEPSTIVLAGIGVFGAVVIDAQRRQRRRNAVVEADADAV